MGRGGLVEAPVGAGGGLGVTVELETQVGGGAEPAAVRDLVDGQVGQLEQATSFEEPLSGEPPLGGGSGFDDEAPSERTGCPAGVPSEIGHGHGLAESLQRPRAGRG